MACKHWQHAGLVCLSNSANFYNTLPMTGSNLPYSVCQNRLLISGRLQDLYLSARCWQHQPTLPQPADPSAAVPSFSE